MTSSTIGCCVSAFVARDEEAAVTPLAGIALRSSALVLNDMINANLRTGNDPEDQTIAQSGLIANTASFVALLRQRRVPIVWVRVEHGVNDMPLSTVETDGVPGVGIRPTRLAPGSREVNNVDELPVQRGDFVVLKPRFNPFIGTELDLLLRDLRVDTILLGGYSTNIGVESCARTARDLGYHVVVLSDCCFNVRVDLHTYAILNILPLFGRVMTSHQAATLLE